jgi:uncharacterized protein YbaR (Trm112 family)
MEDVEVKVGSGGGAAQPICPHCDKELEAVNDHRSKLKTLWELHVISCPHCRKVLEVRTVPK